MKNAAEKKNVLIIDDNTLTRFGLKTALKSRKNFNRIYEAESGAEGLNLAQKHMPELVIVDIGMPDINGAEIIIQLKEINKELLVVVLSSNISENMLYAALSAGARSYCLKKMDSRKLINVIEMVLEGAIWFDPSISGDIVNILNRKPPDEVDLNKHEKGTIPLTDREIEVLRLIVNGHNNAEISEKLFVSIHTAKAHVCNILHKLRVEDRTQAAILALKNNIL